jgi:type IV pilus assembly protein PilO
LIPTIPGNGRSRPGGALLAIFLAIVVGGWWFDWSDQLACLEAKEREEARSRKTGSARSARRQSAEYRRQLSEIDRQFGALLKQLPNRSEMESLLADINQAGSGVAAVRAVQAGHRGMKDFYAELPIAVRVTGSYHDLGEFVGDVAQMPRIVTLNDIAIVTLNDAERRKTVLSSSTPRR